MARPFAMAGMLQGGFAFALLVLLACLPAPAAAAGDSRALGLTIRVEGEGWGTAQRDEIEALLYAVADELVTRPAPVFDHPIVVTHAPGNPVTLYQRGPGGEYLMHLSARDRRWAQFAYQFGHELCHVMSNYAAHAAAGGVSRHQWFEEALCETAALFALRSMAQTWRRGAPYASWEDYAPVLQSYADRLAGEPHRQLPAGMGAARWLATHLPQLARDPYRREHNEVVAGLLLPIFEGEPERWGALHALNRDPDGAHADLAAFFASWHRHAAPEHRGFIAAIAAELGVSETLAEPAVARARLPAQQAGAAGPVSD